MTTAAMQIDNTKKRALESGNGGGSGGDAVGATAVTAVNAEEVRKVSQFLQQTKRAAVAAREANAKSAPVGGFNGVALVCLKKDHKSDEKVPKDRLMLRFLSFETEHMETLSVAAAAASKPTLQEQETARPTWDPALQTVVLPVRPANKATPLPPYISPLQIKVGDAVWAGVAPTSTIAAGDLVRVTAFTAQAGLENKSAKYPEAGKFTNIFAAAKIGDHEARLLLRNMVSTYGTQWFTRDQRGIVTLAVAPFDATTAASQRAGVGCNVLWPTKDDDYKTAQMNKLAVKGIQASVFQWRDGFLATVQTLLVKFSLWQETLVPTFYIADLGSWRLLAPSLLPLVPFGVIAHVNEEETAKMALNASTADQQAAGGGGGASAGDSGASASGNAQFALALDPLFVVMDTAAVYSEVLLPVDFDAMVTAHNMFSATEPQVQNKETWKENAASKQPDHARRVINLTEYDGNVVELVQRYRADPQRYRVEFRAWCNANNLGARQRQTLRAAGAVACTETLCSDENLTRLLPAGHVAHQVDLEWPQYPRIVTFMLIFDAAAGSSSPSHASIEYAAGSSSSRMEVLDADGAAASAMRAPPVPPRPHAAASEVKREAPY